MLIKPNKPIKFHVTNEIKLFYLKQQSHYDVGNESRNSAGYSMHSDYHKDSDHSEYQVQVSI
jgi:hypothetical protein